MLPFLHGSISPGGIRGGHIILLNPATSPYYEATRQQAIEALEAYPGGMQIGGGIREDNAESFLDAGASHVIVTSYVFKNGVINWENLGKTGACSRKETSGSGSELSEKKTDNIIS